jgi:hypothetical protein
MLRQASLPHQALFARGLAMARIGRLLLMVGVLTWLATAAQAQYPFQRGRQPPKLPERPISMSGTIQGVNVTATGVMVEVETEDHQTWLLQVNPTAKVKVTGKGNANSLFPGQNVSFSANIGGKKGTVTEKISKLSVVTPLDQMPMGVGMGMGMGPGPNAGPGPKSGAKTGKKPSGADLAGADAGGPSDVTGVINKVTKSKVSITVEGKKRPMTIELADDVEVTFDLDGPAALGSVGQGAKIDFKGKAQGNFPRAIADDVKVEVVPGESRAGKKAAHKLPHAKSKKGGDDQPDAAGADDEKPEAKKPARHTRKKPEKPDTGDEKPADAGDAKPAAAGDAAAK